MHVRVTALVIIAIAAAPLLAADAPTEPRVRLLKSWDDTVKVEGRDVPRRVEILFDYTRAVALQRIYDADRKLLEERELVDAPPRPSADEFAEAIAIVKADPEIGEIARRTQAIFEGGFLMEGGAPPCGPGTRCVEVQLLDTNRYAAIRKVVVDLVSRRIVVRIFWGGQAMSIDDGTKGGAR